MNLKNIPSANSEASDWITALDDVSLEHNKIHVWRCSLEQSSQQIRKLEATLSESELKRAQRFHFDRGRTHFIVARGVLRIILGCYLKIKPEDICFRYGRKGKPSLSGEMNSHLCFNVSHSHNIALFAFAYDCKIGVDIEYVSGDRTFQGIADRFFSRQEVSALNALPEDKKRDAFFDLWTCKEAYLKAIGTGLSFGLDKVEINIDSGKCSGLASINGDNDEAGLWTLTTLDVASGYSASLAVDGIGRDINCFQWGADLA